jgi:Uma2 family endonuclease
MCTAADSQPVSVEAYLEGEANAKHKHEYVNGFVYLMVGATNTHNRIVTNGTVALGAQLRGARCQVFNSDTKVRVKTLRATRFYYPDFYVVCLPNPSSEPFRIILSLSWRSFSFRLAAPTNKKSETHICRCHHCKSMC